MKGQNKAAILFLLPNLLGFLLFTLGPVLMAAGMSFYHYQLASGEPVFIGLSNFFDLLGFDKIDGEWQARDPDFWYYLGNTLFLMLNIPLAIIGSLLLAVLLNKNLPGRIFFRTFFFIPHLCAGIAIYMVWKMLFTYEPNVGIINGFLWEFYKLLGIAPDSAASLLPKWLISAAWAKPALIIIFIWSSIGGFNMILYLAGLQNISPELYEAAAIDGANGWSKLYHITIPQLAPTTFFILVTSIIGGLQGGFEAAYVMTQGGPEGSTTTVSYYIYTKAYEQLEVGYAATISMCLFFLIFVATLINWRYGGQRFEAV